MADPTNRPMRFNDGQPRTPQGRFTNLPDNPLTELSEGRKIQRWAPGMGAATAQMRGQVIPTAPLTPRASVPSGLPFTGMRTGRTR